MRTFRGLGGLERWARRLIAGSTALLCWAVSPVGAQASQYTVTIEGEGFRLNDTPLQVVGLRLSNSLVSDAKTQEVVDNLDLYASYGVNTVSVFFMGSRFGDVKGYAPDGSLDPTYAARMDAIIRAADARGMVVLVGCLYWGTSAAKEELGGWGQTDAETAVAETVRWLSEQGHRNVLVDPDNEGMAVVQNGWNVAGMIDAAHAIDPAILTGNNTPTDAANSDFNIHYGPREVGKPWFNSELTTGDYWGNYSKDTHIATGYYNYSRIGRYTDAMKSSHLAATDDGMQNFAGAMLASTWLQAGTAEGVNGPFLTPGGHSDIADVNADIDTLHPDAGVLWWLEHMQSAYGAWVAPEPVGPPPGTGGAGGAGTGPSAGGTDAGGSGGSDTGSGGTTAAAGSDPGNPAAGTGGSGPVGVSGASGGGSDPGAAAAVEDGSDDGACSCRVSGSRSGFGGIVGLLLAALFGLRRYRLRREP